MTFDEFQVDFLAFLESSTVNLGRKATKTRQAFMDEVTAKFNTFGVNFIIAEICTSTEDEESKPNSMDDRIVRIKPTDRRKALDAGKGVCAMTPGESMRADEQLGRSSYKSTTEKQGE